MVQLLRVIALLAVVSLCLQLSLVASAKRPRKKKGKCRSRKIPEWLAQVTTKSAQLDFENLKSQNEAFRRNISEKINISQSCMEKQELVQTCKKGKKAGLFDRPICYISPKKSWKKPLRDLHQRFLAFHKLLDTAEKHCNNRGDPPIRHLLEAVENYQAKLLQHCTEDRKLNNGSSDAGTLSEARRIRKEKKKARRACSKQSKHFKKCTIPSQYCSNGNDDAKRTQMLIISTQLQCLLARMTSTVPIVCTSKGPIEGRKYKKEKKWKKCKKRQRKGRKGKPKSQVKKKGKRGKKHGSGKNRGNRRNKQG